MTVIKFPGKHRVPPPPPAKPAEPPATTVAINYTNVDFLEKTNDGKTLVHYKSGRVQHVNTDFREVAAQMRSYLRGLKALF
jgi:hypothetical protein